jgi:hypothetical protein
METVMYEKEENGKTEDGFYQHKETGAVVQLINDPELGTPLTNAYIRAGFIYIGKTDPRIVESEVEDKTVSAQDVYTESTTKNGNVQYRLNGKIISKEQYNNNK